MPWVKRSGSCKDQSSFELLAVGQTPEFSSILFTCICLRVIYFIFSLFINFYHSFFIPAWSMAQMWMSVALIKVAVTSFAIICLEVIIARAKMATSCQQTIIPAMVRLCSTL